MTHLLGIIALACTLALGGASAERTKSIEADREAFSVLVEQHYDRQLAEDMKGGHREGLLELWRHFTDQFGDLRHRNWSSATAAERRAAFEAFGEGLYMVGVDLPISGGGGDLDVSTALATLVSIIAAMETHDEIEPYDFHNAHSIAFALRQWAVEFPLRGRVEYGGFLPFVQDALDQHDGPTLWHVSADLSRMERQPLALGEDVNWLVIASAGCGVARAAVSWISEDVELRAIFADRSLWMVRPGIEAPDMRFLQAWNRQHEDFQLAIMHHLDEWPMIDFRAGSPTFVRVHDGRLVGVHVGWGPAGHEDFSRRKLLEIEAEARSLKAEDSSRDPT